MGRPLHRLTTKGVQHQWTPGMHADGGGLYLRVREHSRSWVFVHFVAHRRREIGLGGYPAVSLAQARSAAAAARQALSAGLRPLSAVRSRRPEPTPRPIQAQECST